MNVKNKIDSSIIIIPINAHILSGKVEKLSIPSLASFHIFFQVYDDSPSVLSGQYRIFLKVSYSRVLQYTFLKRYHCDSYVVHRQSHIILPIVLTSQELTQADLANHNPCLPPTPLEPHQVMQLMLTDVQNF